MAKPEYLQGSLDLPVLKILSRRPGLHGYAIMAAVRELSPRTSAGNSQLGK
jgi:PadR family transcriptional regulator, regulatory protein PadR